MPWREPRTPDELTPAQREALEIDAAATRVARSLGAFDLAAGIALDRLFRGDRLLQLGCSRESDYARERLGVSPSLMFSWLRLARGLVDRPLLRKAVAAGLISTRKALAVMPLAKGHGEAAWTEAAMRLSLREIASAVRAAGKESPEERFEAEAIFLPMTPEQQERLDAGLALAKDTIGPEAKRWQCLEAMCEEWLSDHGEWEGHGEGAAPEADPAPDHGPPCPLRGKILEKQLATAEEALHLIHEIDEEPLTDDALGLHALVLRLVAARRRYDLVFGALAAKVRDGYVPETLGYPTFAEYCEERLGVCAGTVRQRIWLERRMRDLPELREAVVSGRLTYSKALLVAKHATPSDASDRIARAASTTCQQTERETEAEEERKNRRAGVRRLWAPSDAARTLRDALLCAQSWSIGERGEVIDAGEALAVIADHFVEVWTANHMPNAHRMAPLRREVLGRKGGICSVPGCTRAAVHVHHVVYRSRGGKDTKENEVQICAPHHLHGIHLGYLEVTGRAGERLHWKLGIAEAVPLEEWVTLGEDDDRRVDHAPRGPVHGFGGAGGDDGDSSAVYGAGADGAGVVAEGDGRGAGYLREGPGPRPRPGRKRYDAGNVEPDDVEVADVAAA